jgi:hypothetical protein
MSEVPSRSEVWQTFRGMNLTPYHQSKNNLTYIPWSRAWASAMNAFGDHLSIRWHGMTDKEGVTLDHIRYADGTATVCCSAWFGGEKYAECSLAVMDYRNAAIENPSAVDFQNTRQRCQTKLLAMLGLGLYLWENNGEWDDGLDPYVSKEIGKSFSTNAEVTLYDDKPAKAKRKAKATAASEESYEEAERIALDKPEDPVAVRDKLSSVCKALYAADWEADEVLQGRIRKSVKSNDVAEMVDLITMLEGVLPAALILHKDS